MNHITEHVARVAELRLALKAAEEKLAEAQKRGVITKDDIEAGARFTFDGEARVCIGLRNGVYAMLDPASSIVVLGGKGCDREELAEAATRCRYVRGAE